MGLLQVALASIALAWAEADTLPIDSLSGGIPPGSGDTTEPPSAPPGVRSEEPARQVEQRAAFVDEAAEVPAGATPAPAPIPPPPEPEVQGNLQHLCGCANSEFDFNPEGVQALRSTLSDRFASGGGARLSSVTWSDHIWSFGQFLDHDLVATANMGMPTFDVQIQNRRNNATMTMTRLIAEPEAGQPKCRSPPTVATPQIDGGMIYGHDATYLKDVLRAPNSCKLVTSEGDLMPVTSASLNADFNAFVAGDARVNENAVLTSMHTAWLREHNRICDMMVEQNMTADAMFDKARAVCRRLSSHMGGCTQTGNLQS